MKKQTYEFTEEGKKHFAKIHRCIYCKKKLKKRGYGYGESSLNGYCSYAHDNCNKLKELENNLKMERLIDQAVERTKKETKQKMIKEFKKWLKTCGTTHSCSDGKFKCKCYDKNVQDQNCYVVYKDDWERFKSQVEKGK